MKLGELKLNTVFVAGKTYHADTTKIILDDKSGLEDIVIENELTCILVNHDLDIVTTGDYLVAYKPTKKNEIKFTKIFENLHNDYLLMNNIGLYIALFSILSVINFFDVSFPFFAFLSILISFMIFGIGMYPKSNLIEFNLVYRFYKIFIASVNILFSILMIFLSFYFNGIDKYLMIFYTVMEMLIIGLLCYLDFLYFGNLKKIFISTKTNVHELLK